jgi:hypothetical protein
LAKRGMAKREGRKQRAAALMEAYSTKTARCGAVCWVMLEIGLAEKLVERILARSGRVGLSGNALGRKILLDIVAVKTPG